MDYSLFWAVHAIPLLTLFIIIYDIICQFWIHLFARFARSSHIRLPDNVTFMYAIGQFHVHGHQPQCFARFSLNFVKGSGIQDGETLEPLWSPLNKISDSIRGMGTAARQECIDDHMNYSNWCKLTNIRRRFPSFRRPLALRYFQITLLSSAGNACRKSGYRLWRRLKRFPMHQVRQTCPNGNGKRNARTLSGRQICP